MGAGSLGEQLWTLSGIPLLIAAVLGAGYAGSIVSGWLAIPAGLLALGFAVEFVDTLIIGGLIRVIVYPYVTYMLSGGIETFDTGPLVAAMAVAFLCLCITYPRWRHRDKWK